MSAIVITEHVLKLPDSRLHYWLAGPPGAPLVVFTHGATMDHRMFDAQVAALARQYRVLTWDVGGHGDSQPLGPSFSIPGAADDLLAILDQLGVRQATFVGQSMGGYISQEIAFRHPQRVTALVMIGCACATLRLTTSEAFAMRLSGPLLGLYSADELRRLIAQQTALKPDVRAYAYAACSRVSKHDFLTIWAAMTRCIHYEPNYHITQPLLLTLGEADDLGNFKQIYPKWAARDTGGRFVLIPDAGHNANQDNPTFFNAVLLNFLQQHIPLIPNYEQPIVTQSPVG